MPTQTPQLLRIYVGTPGTYPLSDNFIYVRANSAKDAIRWLLDNDVRFSDPTSITVDKLPTLVDLVSGAVEERFMEGISTKMEEVTAMVEDRPDDAHPGHLLPPVNQAPPSPLRPPKAAKPGAPSTGDDITLDEAMQLTGLNKNGVKNRKHQGTFEAGAARGTVTRASVTAWLEAGGQSTAPKSSPDRMQKMRDAKAAKAKAPVHSGPSTSIPPKPPTQSPASTFNPTEEDFVQEDKLAKELNMDLAQLRMVKAAGKVPGGFGWVDRTAFEVYMDTPEYKASL